MAFETFSVGYAKLLDVWVQHRYFLNYGITPFENIAIVPDDIRLALQKISNQYNVQNFWHIQADTRTQALMNNQKIIVKPIPYGLRIGVAVNDDNTPFIELPSELKLTFEIMLNDGYFMIYTDIEKTVSDALSETIISTEGGKFVLRNQIFRLKNNIGNELLNVDETIKDGDLTIFIPEASRIQRPPMGLIEITHSATNSLLEVDGKVKTNPPNFKVILKNRFTTWETSKGILVEPAFARPLVKNGRIEAYNSSNRKLPNPTPSSTVFRENDNAFHSVIY